MDESIRRLGEQVTSGAGLAWLAALCVVPGNRQKLALAAERERFVVNCRALGHGEADVKAFMAARERRASERGRTTAESGIVDYAGLWTEVVTSYPDLPPGGD